LADDLGVFVAVGSDFWSTEYESIKVEWLWHKPYNVGIWLLPNLINAYNRATSYFPVQNSSFLRSKFAYWRHAFGIE